MNRPKRKFLALVPVIAALLFSTAANLARAAVSGAEFGPRIGVSSDPDQMVLGGQLEFPEFAPHMTVDPNVELGFLDNRTVVSLNADFYYHFAIQSSAWAPYAGMGLSVNVTQFENDVFGNSNSESNAGANLVLGAGVPTRSGNRFFGELRVGLGDIPALKFMAGWNFRM